MKSVFLKFSFIGYALISLGQLWLYSLNLRTEDIFERVTINTNEWIGSHIILFIGVILNFPAIFVLWNYCKEKGNYLVIPAIASTLLGSVAFGGQCILDFYFVDLFEGQTSKSAYESLNQIFSNDLLTFLCYDLITAWFLGQVLFILVLLKKSIYPKWAISLFIIALLLAVFGDNIHEIIKRSSYIFISIALIPIFCRNSK